MDEKKPISPVDTESVNIASKLPEAERKKAAGIVCDNYNTDKKGREEWEKKRDRWYKLWLMQREPKSDPWPGCSNVCLPLLAVSCNQFHSRSYQAMFSPPQFVKCMATESNDVRRGKNVEEFMNWQLMYDMEDFEDEHDKLLLNVPINGVAFMKSYYDSRNERPVSEYVSGMNIILPYRTKKLKEARRITHEIYLHYDQLAERNRRGLYVDFDKLNPEGSINQTTDIEATKDKAETSADTSAEMPKLILECHMDYKFPGDDEPKPYILTVDKESQTLLRATSRKMTVSGKEYIANYFTDYHFIPNPEGFYSFGFGHFLENLNEMGNTAFNQIFDAGRISNQPFGFYGRRAGLKKRELKLWPGKMEEVEDASQIHFPNMQRLDGTLFQVLGLVQQYAEQFTSTSDYLLGRESKGTKTPTATGTLAIIEQGLILYSIMIKRLFRSFKKELGNIYTINALCMPESKQYRVMGKSGELAFPTIKRRDFEGKLDVIPVGDPSYASRLTRRQEANEILNMTLSNPLVVANPKIQVLNPKAVVEAYRSVYETYERKDLTGLLPEIPEPPVSPEVENSLFMQGDFSEPKPGENHMEHLKVHLGFKGSPFYADMPVEYKALLDKHLMATQSVMYQELEAKMAMQGQMPVQQPMQPQNEQPQQEQPMQEGPQEQVQEQGPQTEEEPQEVMVP